MGDTSIEWANKSWNPIRARNTETGEVGWFCEHASPGCDNCYAEKMNVNTYFGNGLPYKAGSRPKLELFLDEKMLTQPLRWREPKRIFPCSMTDLFGRFVPDEWLDRIFAVMGLARQHTFQILTKRHKRMLEHVTRLGKSIAPLENAARALGYTFKFQGVDRKEYCTLPWPLPNAWLGVSVEDQKTADERIPLLLQTPAAVRWLSIEPLLGPVDLSKWLTCQCGLPTTKRHWSGARECVKRVNHVGHDSIMSFDWVVVGGESGRGARPMDIAWAKSLVSQCKAADVACFVKQLGANPVELSAQNIVWRVPQFDRKGGDINEWPEELRIRQYPRAVAPMEV